MDEPIAIVGTACRFPGSANSPSKLWDLLHEARDVVCNFPPERLNLSNFYSQNGESHGRTDVHQKSYLLQEDIRLFDAAFFRINPKEAAGMDPQHRILLETAYEAFEAAGWPLHAMEGSQTSVHVGVMTDDYYTIQARDPDTMDSHAATGLSRSILSNRVSYAFNLKGPSMTVDTACSSSLVALHLAVQGLRKGEAAQALVAGVNLLLDPHWFITESSLHMLSPDSRSRMWDKDANGYARGDGCAAVVLKPLSKAIQDGDHIECVIRETGVNSDGRTDGVTMPSPVAQAALIRQTYRNAGLDPVADRCQYFECHGTGTQAGDPVEACAIRDAFFPDNITHGDSLLYCGSIKTVIGHLEGCAGLAGLLKASLAIQNEAIPPNMHFNELSPSVEPFYANLRVPKSLLPWPETHGKPRRASINSFGFGGTNAHAIIESFHSQPHEPSPVAAWSALFDGDADGSKSGPGFIGPFVFSASSRASLINSLKGLLDHLHANPSLDLDALSYVLQSRRTIFSHRIAIPASQDRQNFVKKLEEQINIGVNTPIDGSFGVRALNSSESKERHGILGIFTGQGAQAAQMGRQLLEHCNIFRESIKRCEDALISLPEGPNWSLYQELVADEGASRLSEARISQPLCTAIQIALVDLLRAAGIHLSTVVGHSSGEIGAAYAAGILNLRDAMGIAYYRGYVAYLAEGTGGKRGSMMAAVMSFHDATTLCSESRFAGRVSVAASNAPSSVTLSGDMDAIKEIQVYLEERQIQTRQLRVDTAYHSHHIICCAEKYLAHLKMLDIQIQQPSKAHGSCAWISSVRPSTNMLQEPLNDCGLDGQYWVDNMVQTVLFSEAIEFAVQTNPTALALALEVGPHPALKGPVSQTLKTTTSHPLPYASCLERGKGSTMTMSAAIGMVWSYFHHSSVDFCGWREAFGMLRQDPMLKDLPSYPWDHDQIHWRESRLSHNYRVGIQTPHNLLGRPRDNSPHETTWRNIFHLSEMPWLRGHTFQGQVLFPGAGYVSLAVEATKSFVGTRPLKLIEIREMNIWKPLVIGEDEGVEVLFTIRSKILPASIQDGSVLEAEFAAYSCPDERVLERTCDGRLFIHMGQKGPGDLPATAMSKSELTPLSIDRFYRAASEIGLGYEEVFRALTSISRSWGHAKATASWAKNDLEIGSALHPALLDAAFQVGLATFVSTAERAMGSSYLPVGIKRVIIDPNQNYNDASGATSIIIEALMASSRASMIEVDINVCAQLGDSNEVSGVQVDGLILKAIVKPQPSDDRNLFVKTIWGLDIAYGVTAPSSAEFDMKEWINITDVYERITLFYMQNLIREVSAEELAAAKWHHQELFRYISTTLVAVREGNHTTVQIEWLEDSRETAKDLCSRYADDADIAMLTAVGENLPSVVRGESEMMEHMLKDDLLSRLYKESRGLAACNRYVVDIMRQISHKYPRTKILEIGAGTGGTTLSVLDVLGDSFSSYTCTDISASFFIGLAEKIPGGHRRKIDFKVFNVENAPAAQGFTEGTYDVVIAANVLHATRKLSETIQNTRALLRPGGYLIAIEVTGTMLRETGLMGALEGWWLGVGEGRTRGPGIDAREWDNLLRQNGFAGIDCIAHDHPDVSRHSCSVFAAQATDDRFDLLRDPIASIDLVPASPIFIIGGKTLAVSKLINQSKKILCRWSRNIKTCDGIDDLDPTEIPPGAFVLCLSDLDKAFFSESLTTQRLKNLQDMLTAASNILWVTCGRLLDDPYSNMMVGIGRALAVELPHVNIHYLDFDHPKSWEIEVIVCQVLRMALSLSSEGNGQDMLSVQEPEIVIRDGQMLVPRIVQDHAANKVFNAKRRRISKLIEPAERIEVAHEGGSSSSISVMSDTFNVPVSHIAIDVEMSLALHADEEMACFLCFGYSQDSGAAAFALSETDSSTVVVHADSLFEPPTAKSSNAETLVGMGSSLIASCVLYSLPMHGTTLVFGATDSIADAILAAAAQTGHQVLFVAVSTAAQEGRPDWITIHPRAPARLVQQLIPRDSSALLSFSNEGVDTISQCLPKGCIVQAFHPSRISHQTPAAAAAALGEAHRAQLAPALPITTVKIQEAAEKLLVDRKRLSAVLDWRREGPVSAVLQPLEARNAFSPSKTYLLVGMAGELGQSLCRFMVRGGARYIVLASRNPTKDPHWLDQLRSNGTDIRIIKMDVTDRLQVRETVAMLRRSMPKIGGVANAALVFEAGIFTNFSAKNVTRQLKPKVDGSVNLDQEFETDDLDFFLAFGSLATVCGNPGQAMYHAGNMFMSSLVEKRRRRGRAASILNFGLLVDVGYVARTDRAEGTDIEGTLRSLLLTPLSEAEFHHVVLQGIISGRPTSASGEVIMGMEPYIDDGRAASRPPWVNKAFFSHMIHAPAASEGSTPVTEASSSMQDLREKLHGANNAYEASVAVQEMFCKKIEFMIKVPKTAIDPDSPVSHLGLDSLHAIEIRNWLLKEMQINFPLLRILGRESLSSICASVAQWFMDSREGLKGEAEEKEWVAENAQLPERSGTLAVQAESQTIATESEFQREQSQSHASGSASESACTLTSDSPTLSNDETPWTFVRGFSKDSNGRVASPSSTSLESLLVRDICIKPPRPEKTHLDLEYRRTERLSFAQAGIQFLHTFLDDPTTFNITTRYTIRGPLNANRLARAIEKTLGHHEIYQTSFFADSGSPEVKQHVASSIERCRFTHVHSEIAKAEEHARSVFDTVADGEYQLAAGESFRAVLVTHEPEWHTLVIGFHLVVSDALSFSIFLGNLDCTYQMLPLSSNPGSFLDFASQQHDDLEAGRFDGFIAYWKGQLSPLPTELPLLPIAHVRKRQPRRVYGNHITEMELRSGLAHKVRKVSQTHGSTSMQFYLAAMQVLLARLADIDDICIGVTDSGRGRTGEFADAIGHFANILPMRFNTNHGQSFEELLEQTSHTVLSAFDNAPVPFDVLLERLGIERSSVSTPLFQAAFNYRVGDILERPLGNCTMVMEKYTDVKTAYDLTINVTQTGARGQMVELITADSLYSLSATKLIMDTYISLIETLTEDQSIKIKDCKLFDGEQTERGLSLGRGPTVEHSWPETMSERFQQVHSASPDSVAIKDSDESLTYDQLAHRVGLYSASLLEANVKAGFRIAVLCEPSIDLYATMLASLHIGAVYIPLDISLPAARRREMKEACKPDILVFHAATSKAAAECCDNDQIPALNLSKLRQSSQKSSFPAYIPQAATDDSFILFTSGSSGTPKGIRLGQGGIMNYAASKSEILGLGQVKVLQQTSAGFDMAIAQAFNAFANGGTLIVAPLTSRGDPNMIAQLMLSEEIEFTLCTPSEYLMLTTFAADTLRQCTSWCHACSGGEAATDRLFQNLRRLELPSLTLTDCYGPTETSCATTFQSIPVHAGADVTISGNEKDGAVRSVGKAIPNTSIYILSDDGMTALPSGMPGEICIAGSGVARGYLDANLSHDKFVANPFATPADLAKGWSVIYKTGDKGFIQSDGSLVFLGRTDGGGTVIKLRGLRIDLTEVAGAILKEAPDDSLADAVVTVRGQPQYLVCHVTFMHGKYMEQTDLDLLLQGIELPRYMIPSVIVPLERLPTTPNGKADRETLQKLPLPAIESKRNNESITITVPEGELREIWMDVLGEAANSANISPLSDFFMVGGSSLLLVHLQSALRERTGVALSLQELYQATTLRSMALAMHKERGQLAEETIDWDVETAIPSYILEATKNLTSSLKPQKQRRQVLLTGSTTFLGGEILRQLIGNDNVAKIHCIAVSDAEQKKLPSDDNGKTAVYAGSLLSPSLGLSSEEIVFLRSNVDQIIHAAVQGHCMNNYMSVRQALYLSTQCLVNLIGQVPFHFISAPRVVLLSGQVEGRPVSMTAHCPPTDGSQGVTAAKWASECFLEKLNRETGFPVVIHRPCALIGERASADDVMNSVVRFSLLTRKVPNIPRAEGFFDFKDVTEVASDIAGQPLVVGGPVHFCHHSSNTRVPFNRFAQRLQELYGGEFEVVDPADWLKAAAAFGMEELLVIHLRANMESGKPFVFPYLGA